MTALPVYALAGEQDDPLAEEVLAVLFSDQPGRTVVRPGDTRRHWQWWARDPAGQTSRLWLSSDQPITDDTTTSIETRAAVALSVFVPDFVSSVDVTAQQTAFDEVALTIVIERPLQVDLTLGLVLGGNGGNNGA